jgi:1-deoxy-D-xylulose-5-phosphate reductoisomerase
VLAHVTPEQALKHPTWQMGPKITIDSATLMNKALEVIEARWLFGLDPDQIEVVVHPESVVHSMVEFVDGSVIAQLSPPDMRLPVQYALTYPDRMPCPSPRLDLSRPSTLTFEPPDHETFTSLALGFEVMEKGGTAGAALNAANESAVDRFLQGAIGFLDIPRACRAVLDHHTFDPRPTLDDLWKVDAWARQEVARWAP